MSGISLQCIVGAIGKVHTFNGKERKQDMNYLLVTKELLVRQEKVPAVFMSVKTMKIFFFPSFKTGFPRVTKLCDIITKLCLVILTLHGAKDFVS